jgi:hypothetical protein
MSEARIVDRLLLWIWCICCFAGTVCIFIYLPMSTRPAMEQLSEHPGPLTLIFGLCAGISVGIVGATWQRPPFAGGLRKPMLIGTAASVLGFTGYSTYVYAFSQTLATAEAAPQVGSVAPDFQVTDPEGREWSLQTFHGAAVLLVFYRGHW